MNPDFHHFIEKHNAHGKPIYAYLNGSLTVEKDRNGTAIHGHTGEWPDRYCLSVWVKLPRREVNRRIKQWDEHCGSVLVVLTDTKGPTEIGDSGERYTLFPARLPKP